MEKYETKRLKIAIKQQISKRKECPKFQKIQSHKKKLQTSQQLSSDSF